MWVPSSEQQTVDTEANTVTATVDHFSIYAVFNIRNWNTTNGPRSEAPATRAAAAARPSSSTSRSCSTRSGR